MAGKRAKALGQTRSKTRNPAFLALVAETIQRRRVEHGLSQHQLAAKLTCSRNTLAMIETGQCAPGLMTMFELMHELGIEVRDIYFKMRRL